MIDRAKKGSKTLLGLCVCQANSVKNYKSNKGLDSSTLGPSTNDPNYATSSSVKMKNCRTAIPHQKDSLDQKKKKKEKKTFNPQWLEKFGSRMKRSLMP